MHLTVLNTHIDLGFERAMGLYAASFPAHEQRATASQQEIMANPQYRFQLIYDEQVFVGLLLCWETQDFIYVEHFCIDPSLRGKGYGTKALELLADKGKVIILEIDPTVDEISRRRLRFYELAGYCVNTFTHVHPPYHAGVQGHRLVVLSYGRTLEPVEYEGFSRYLNEVVMKDAIKA